MARKKRPKRIKLRAIELFSKDTPFKPKVVQSKKRKKPDRKIKDEDYEL